MILISYSSQYEDMLKIVHKEHGPEIKKILRRQIKLFRNKPSDNRLQNHTLTGRLRNKWAFSVTDDIRVIYMWKGKNKALFIRIGTHQQVYSRN